MFRAAWFILLLLVSAAAHGQALGPRTVTPWQVQCAEMPVSTPPPSGPLRVAASERGDGRRIMAPGELVVIRAGTEQGLVIGQTLVAQRFDRGREGYTSARRGRPGPAFGRSGYRGGVRTTALLTVERLDAGTALARIVKACDQVEVGDVLAPATILELPAPAGDGPPAFEDGAMVLFGRDLREAFGDGDILSIDRGTRQGVVPGARYAIYSAQAPGLPMTETGEAVVLDVAETASRAVLVRATGVVRAGDVAVRRASGEP